MMMKKIPASVWLSWAAFSTGSLGLLPSSGAHSDTSTRDLEQVSAVFYTGGGLAVVALDRSHCPMAFRIRKIAKLAEKK